MADLESKPAADTVSIPEPFRSALDRQCPETVRDAPAPTAEALYGRGRARAIENDHDGARHDFEAALPSLGDVCAVEIAWLDVEDERTVRAASAAARNIALRASERSLLRARALTVLGLAEHRLRHGDSAVSALVDAAEVYRVVGATREKASVHEALGRVLGSRGRLDIAVHHYALALMEQALAGERGASAMTLVRIGRLQLQAGRYREALDCFERARELAQAASARYPLACVLNSLGEAAWALERFEEAEAAQRQCIEVCQAEGFEWVEFFAHRALSLMWAQCGRPAVARAEMEAAQALAGKLDASELPAYLAHAEGEILLAEGSVPAAIARLEDAVQRFVNADLPDFEIPARVALAKALAAQRLTATAERCLLAGLQRARRGGYARYVPILNDAMEELGLVEGAVAEPARPFGHAPDVGGNGYLIRERLGGGAFGEVFRAYDPERAMEVAVKRIALSRLYDGRQRERLIVSAHVEIEAVSRVRHPGVVRVLAISRLDDGDIYVVEEFIAGQPLKALMPKDTSADIGAVLRNVERMAHALAAIHAVGVVHRDLKPSNVMMRDDDGSPVIVDFGIARAPAALMRFGDDMVMGTLAYIAPEQGQGRTVDGRADVYSLGVICFEWLTGTRPLTLQGEDARAKLADLARRPPDALSAHRADVPPQLETFVARLLVKDPEQRPAAVDVADQAASLAAALQLSSSA